MSEKPPYRVPTMDEIPTLPKNGVRVISTFSGCGGSSLGYRMAGCSVIGASEFVPAAIDVYRANADPDTTIWTDDIRKMTGAEMLADTGLQVGELDILDGSPPCAAFSLAGRRSEGWGKVRKYSDTAQRSDDLFYEYARLISEMQPRMFVAENVAGLVRGVAKGYYKRIHEALSERGYTVRAAVLDAALLGAPQSRQRVIFIGARNDLGVIPIHPKPHGYVYSLRDAIGDVQVLRRNFGGERLNSDRPMPTITTSYNDWWAIDDLMHDPETGKLLARCGEKTYARLVKARGLIEPAGTESPLQARKLTLAELRRICSFPDDFILTGSYEQRWERLGRAVPPVMMKHIASAVVETLCAAS